MIKFEGHFIGRRYPFFLIAGPCVIEDRDQSIAVARHLKTLGEELGILVVFKSSFDKANRTAGSSFRGPGMKAGLKILADIKDMVGLPVLTDIHLPAQAGPVGEVVDVIQIPAFLCRQTDLLEAAGKTNKIINIKKGQFASPREIVAAAEKVKSAGGDSVMLCERGTTFGYHNLVVDMRSLDVMAQSNYPVIFDATHSVQLPASQGYQSGGQREYVPVLARAAVAVGIAGLFMEVHPNPENALSDGPNAWPLELLDDLIRNLQELDVLVKARFSSEIDV